MNGSMEALVLAEMYSDESNAEEDWNEVKHRLQLCIIIRRKQPSVLTDVLDYIIV